MQYLSMSVRWVETGCPVGTDCGPAAGVGGLAAVAKQANINPVESNMPRSTASPENGVAE